MQGSEIIRNIYRRVSVVPFFVEYPDDSPIGGDVDIVFIKKGVVLVKSAPSHTNVLAGPLMMALGGAGAVGALIGSATDTLLKSYRSRTQDRKLEEDILAPLVENGVAISGLFKDLICEIQEEGQGWLDVLNMVTFSKECWVTFRGVFLFAGKPLNGSFSYKMGESPKRVKKMIEDYCPIEAKCITEKLPISKLTEKWWALSKVKNRNHIQK
jgi:hypothetical protein